jgi:two-component system NarL family sensor kinase
MFKPEKNESGFREPVAQTGNAKSKTNELGAGPIEAPTKNGKTGSEAAITAELAGMNHLHELNRRLTGMGSLDTALNEILALAIEITETDRGNIQLFDPATNSLHIVAHHGLGHPFLDHFKYNGCNAACEASLKAKNRVVIEDIRLEPALWGTKDFEIFEEDGIRAVQSTPLITRQGAVIGMLSTHFTAPHRSLEGQFRVLDLLASIAADFIEHINSQLALRESEAWLNGQKQAFQATMSGKSLSASLKPLIETIIAQTNGEARAAFYMVPADGEGLQLVAGLTEEHANNINGFGLGPDSLARGPAMHIGEPVITPDVELEPLCTPFLEMARKHNYRSCWSFPICAEDGPALGTFVIYFEQPREPKPRELELAGILAHAAAIIISRHKEAEERSRAEAAFRDSEARTRMIIETDAVSVQFYDKDCVLIDANEVFLKTTGWTNAEIATGKINWRTMTPEEWVDVTEQQIAMLKETGRIGPYEREYLFKDGRRSWMLSTGRDLGDGTIVIFAIDINDRKIAEAALKETELRYRMQLERQVQERTADLNESHNLLQATLDSNHEMIQVFEAVRDENNKIIDFTWILNNAASEQQYGNVIGESLLKNNPGVVKEGIFNAFTEVTETGIPQQYEKHYIHEQFEGWFYQSVVKLNDGVATNTINITDRKKAIQQLQESRDLLQTIFDASLHSFSVLKSIRNDAGQIIDFEWLYANNQVKQRANIGELVGKRFTDGYPGVEQTIWLKRYADVVESGETYDFEDYYSITGRWFHVVAQKFDDGLIVTAEDTTFRKEAEQEIIKNHRLLESIYNTTHVGLSVFKPVYDDENKIKDFEIVIVNKRIEDSTGRKNLVGKLYAEEFPGARATGIFDMMTKTMETGEIGKKEYFYDYEGVNRWYSTICMRNDNMLVCSNMDMTEQKQAEQKNRELDERQRELEEWQQQQIFRTILDTQEVERKRIAEALHNSLGQILYGTKLGLDQLYKVALNDEDKEKLKNVDKLLNAAITESRRLSHQLMPVILEDFGLKTAVEDICRQLSGITKFNCRFRGLTRRLDKYLEIAIYRIIQELMMNVVKHAGATEALVAIEAQKGQLSILVRDNGKGFNAGAEKAAGIGLKTIQNKVSLLNGNINTESEAGKGTVIDINIPLKFGN